MSGFRICRVDLAGGGRIGICHLPGLHSPLEEDVSQIIAWRPAIVLTLLELSESDCLAQDHLSALLRPSSIDWQHFPVQDFGVLEGASLAMWPGLSGRLHAILNARRGVLVHCRGGLGRSGMIALRLMVERGEDPESAFERLRKARPGAVETDAQLGWSTRGKMRSLGGA
ncbi:MAG: protein-tyrosine phosphatase family protein [Pseudomonadota bacterium]